jgi:hypothetical protein
MVPITVGKAEPIPEGGVTVARKRQVWQVELAKVEPRVDPPEAPDAFASQRVVDIPLLDAGARGRWRAG